MPTKVFVYGTLKEGFGNHALLEDAELLGVALTDVKYQMRCNGGFPSVFKTSSHGGRIIGEVYEVDSRTLDQLDRLEGVDSRFYFREEICVHYAGAPGNDGAELVHIYFRCGDAEHAGELVPPASGCINWRPGLVAV